MTSKPSLTTTPKPSPTLAETVADAFTSTEYNDVTGCVTVNAVDALMAIANAINRLAAVQEQTLLRDEQMVAAVMAGPLPSFPDDEPGHA
jgi:hypothetical protein